MRGLSIKKHTKFLGTKSLPLGSLWEIGLTAKYVYRKSRVYLKPGDNDLDGPIIYVDEKNQLKYMIQDGRKTYLKTDDTEPDATYVYLGKRGGRYLISEERIEEIVRNPRKYSSRIKPKKSPKHGATTGEKDIGDLWN